MRSPVKFKLNEEQMTVVQSFAVQVGLSVEDFCKQAVFYAINHATQKAEQLQRDEQDGTHDAAPAIAERDGSADEQDTTSGTLPNS